MLPTKGYAAMTNKAPLEPYQFERRDTGPNDVLIEILFCGICHTDIHFTDGAFADSIFPMVPGHEIVGRVTNTGANVTKHKIGDTVGVGCFVESCRTCSPCKQGEENFCEGMIYTYGGVEKDAMTPTYGGYSNQIVVDENYVLQVSSKLSPASTAPLLCAGITMYSPLRHWKVGKGSKVGVIGLGGLGHMGVKIGAAMGAEITIFSRSNKKRADAQQLGASDYADTSDPETFQRLAGSFDLILNTVGADISYDAYVNLLKQDGTFVQIGVLEKQMPITAGLLMRQRRNISGSIIGGIAETQEMLDFCAEHNIGSDIEVIPMDKVNEAYERVIKSDVRYRFVIDMATL